MKGILEFKLNKPLDKLAFKRCNKAEDMAFFIFEFVVNDLRNIQRQLDATDETSLSEFDVLDMVREKVQIRLHDFDINIDELI